MLIVLDEHLLSLLFESALLCKWSNGYIVLKFVQFLRVKAATAFSASLPSQFCLSVCLSVCHTGGSGKNGAS